MNATRHQLLAIASLLLPGSPANAQIDQLLAPLTTEAQRTIRADAKPAAAPSSVLGADAFVTEIEKELSARLSLNGELKLTLAQPWKALKLPASDFAVVISETPASGITGTFIVHAKVTSGGELVSDLQVSLRAQLWQEVWTAASRLERGQPLDRSLLTTTRVDVLREHQPQLLADTDPSTLEVAQTVGASRALTKRDVIERPLVRRGQVVEVVAQQGLLAISMKGLALESGARGELIKLRNLESRREFSAQILNENKVQVHF